MYFRVQFIIVAIRLLDFIPKRKTEPRISRMNTDQNGVTQITCLIFQVSIPFSTNP